MNIKTIIIGSLALVLAIGGTFFKITSQDKKSVYAARSNENTKIAGHAGYAEYIHMLKEDPATGQIDYNLVNQTRNEIIARSKQHNKAAIGLNWTQMGPDNVGGRTRAVLVDQSNSNVVYAGSIAGGLFVSTNGTQTWSQVAGHEGVLGENLIISCITQTQDGRIFFGTGSYFEGATGPFAGNGVYEYVPATGNVLAVLTNAGTLPNNNPAAQLSEINSIKSRGNRLYIATKAGFYWADASSGIYPTTLAGWTNPVESIPGVLLETGRCLDIAVGSDGGMLVCFSNKIYRSNSDAFGSFTKTTIAGSRFNAAIAPSNPNVYYLLRSAVNLLSLDISLDKGATWSTIVPGGSPCIDPFVQNDCTGAQGDYDAAIAVDPSDWGHVLVGGVQLYEWKYNAGSNPIGGSWLKAANLFESPFNPYYVHADKHTIVWPSAGTIYIGCDGGVFRSVNGGASFQERNLGYNVTTFYDVATSANGFIMGGAQDNGTQLFSYGSFGEITPLGSTEISSGDGFDCAFSNQGPGIAYATSQFGSLSRLVTGGAGGSFFNTELNTLIGAGNEPFHTVIENWELNNDPLSIDSVSLFFDSLGTNTYGTHANGDPISGGDTIFSGTMLWYESQSNGTVLQYVVPSNIILNAPADTIKLFDGIQNKFAFATSAGVYLTRDAARLNALSPKWFRVANTVFVESLEFSADGNNLFIGTRFGQLWRVSNLSMGNTYNGLDIRNSVTTSPNPDSNRVTTITQIGSFGGVVTGIAADPNDVENLIVTIGGYTASSHVYRSTNAFSAVGTAGTFTSIQGATLPLPFMPVYDPEIDYNDNDKVIIGTDWGVWTSDNAFSASAALVEWTDESGNGMTHVPVFAVEQQTLRSNQSVNSGFVYLGTHGRGFYMTQDLFTAVDENAFADSKENETFVSNLSVYPNPVNNSGTISFDLSKQSDSKVNIYSLMGSLVKTIDLGKQTKGNHKVKFDASSLSVGSYIISLESGSERSVAKFIVTR